MHRTLAHEAARKLIMAFIFSRLDYCNSLLYGVSDNLIRRVQSVQNAAARRTRRSYLAGFAAVALAFCPVQRRVDYKLACFVFSSLSGHAPPYLADDIHLVSEGPRRRLRSSTDDRSCAVPRTHNTFGDRGFVWNSLPAHLRDEDHIQQFQA